MIKCKKTTWAGIVTLLHLIIITLSFRSYFQLLIHLIYSLACVNMSKIASSEEHSGEYRGRTDDLLHAMQAL